MKLYVRDKAAILLGKLYSMRKMDFQFFDIDDMMKRIAGSEANDVGEKRKVLEEAYRKTRAYELFDPIGIEKEIEKLKEEIDGFLKDVDVVLSLSNAVTFIEVDL